VRFRSLKMQRIYRERRVLVAEMLDDAVCARCDGQRATEVHELKSRARGGSILDRDNLVALCHDCHFWVTTHPRDAYGTGWLKKSTD